LSEKQDEAEKESASNAVESEPKSKLVKMSMDQAYAEIEKYKQMIPEKDAAIADLTSLLEEANKLLDSQVKGKLISEILPRTTLTNEQLWTKSVEELKTLRADLDIVVPPKVNSVRFGVGAANLSDKDKGLTVGDISWPTAQRRKAAS
jgi:hypothetical protein